MVLEPKFNAPLPVIEPRVELPAVKFVVKRLVEDASCEKKLVEVALVNMAFVVVAYVVVEKSVVRFVMVEEALLTRMFLVVVGVRFKLVSSFQSLKSEE